ncbi:MAG: 50S ribosomal protein L15 [Planctomycetes bacterium]|nr:50S ribosomal protein L15 [Planctomycetota bacterium]
MDLHEVVKGTSSLRRKQKRRGRGPGSGSGKTAGRGTKGLRARSGGSLPPWYEGGATPTYRRFPKKGFNNARFASVFDVVNVGAVNSFDEKSVVGPDELRNAGLVNGRLPVKLLAKGEISKPLTIRVHAVSASALAKVQAAGGTVELLEKQPNA